MLEFLPSLAVLASFILAAFIMTITPGPDMMLFLAQSMTNGKHYGLVSMAGTCAGILLHSGFAAIGLSALLSASSEAFYVLKLVGSVYLLWLAYQAIRHGTNLTQTSSMIRKRSLSRCFFKGLMINLLNPKAILFFVTFLPQFISPSDPHAASKLLFLGFWFVIVYFPLCIPMIIMAERMSLWLRQSRKAARFLDWSFASIMSAFAVRLLFVEAK
jgi:threonine/homoserine/homoserine lactone efflux protein